MRILQIKRSLFSVLVEEASQVSVCYEILQSLSKMFKLCILIRYTHIDARLLNWIPLFVSSDKTWHNLKQPWKTNSDRELFCHFMHQSKTYSHFYSLPKKYKFCWNLFFYGCRVKQNFLIRLSEVLGIVVALDNICFALLLFSYDWCLSRFRTKSNCWQMYGVKKEKICCTVVSRVAWLLHKTRTFAQKSSC